MAVADRSAAQQGLAALALTLLMAGIWSMTHRYRELSADAELYAVQALAKLHPALATDVYLQNASQDRYTVFSWFYSKVMAQLGLHQAARCLYVACSAWSLAAAWFLMRRLSDARIASLSVVLLMILVGHYGAYGVFRFSEEYLTARSVAEAMSVTALACFFGGARVWAVAIAVAAMFIHPLMALPGLFLLVCLWAPPRLSINAALAGICAAGLLALTAQFAARPAGFLALIDGTWLAVVRERSQFLFLQLWRSADWKTNALPFASLALTLLVVPDQRMRRLAVASMLVGASGLCVAFIASTIGPAAILLQGQAWRWVWIPSFTAIVLLGPTFLWLWRNEKCGPACAMLILCGTTFVAVNIWACLALTLLLWLMRARIPDRIAHLLRWAALALALVLIAWTLGNIWMIAHSPSPEGGREPALAAALRNILGLPTACLMVCGLSWWWVSTRRSLWTVGFASVAFGVLAALALPGALKQITTVGTDAEIKDYADWRNAIPAGSNVAVAGVHNSASFVWFTLGRADYLSIDQSSGVVFSRATAEEIKRRSEVLEPLQQPSYKIMSYLARAARGEKVDEERDKPLTAAALIDMCHDKEIDFLIARESVGFDPLRHTLPGAYKDWYLYDCRHVRFSGRPA